MRVAKREFAWEFAQYSCREFMRVDWTFISITSHQSLNQFRIDESRWGIARANCERVLQHSSTLILIWRGLKSIATAHAIGTKCEAMTLRSKAAKYTSSLTRIELFLIWSTIFFACWLHHIHQNANLYEYVYRSDWEIDISYWRIQKSLCDSKMFCVCI